MAGEIITSQFANLTIPDSKIASSSIAYAKMALAPTNNYGMPWFLTNYNIAAGATSKQLISLTFVYRPFIVIHWSFDVTIEVPASTAYVQAVTSGPGSPDPILVDAFSTANLGLIGGVGNGNQCPSGTTGWIYFYKNTNVTGQLVLTCLYR